MGTETRTPGGAAPDGNGDAQELAVLDGIERGTSELSAGDEALFARLFAHPSKPVRLRAAAALATAISAERVAAGFCERLLENERPDVRWTAAFAVSRAGSSDGRVVEVAVEALDVEDGDVRWAAASIVTRAAREAPALRERLRGLSTSGSPRSRKMALLCLCECGVTDGALYRGALGDPDPFVRLAAITSLGRCGDRSAESLAAIRDVSERDQDVRVRRGAGAIFARLTAPAPGL